MRFTCVYHYPCLDGFTAAWVVHQWARRHGHTIEWLPCNYGQEPTPIDERLAGQHVLFADFSFKADRMLELVALAASVTVYDHHKTAEEELEEVFRRRSQYATTRDSAIGVVFDKERSGAGIVWDELFSGEKRPLLLNDVEDRDLWRFSIPESREVNAALFSYDYDFDLWDRLFWPMEVGASVIRQELVTEGRAIVRKMDKDVREFIAGGNVRRMSIGDASVPVANLPYFYASEAAGKLAEGEVFAACYYDTPTDRRFSLRSREGGADVSLVARKYGGGGHAGAAGFEVPLEDLEKLGLE